MLAHLAARIANYLVSLLRNRTDLSLSREEFRYSRISFSQFGDDLAILSWIAEILYEATANTKPQSG